MKYLVLATCLNLGVLTHSAFSQESSVSAAVQPESQEGINILFPSGSSALQRDQTSSLDLAARTFRDGNPVVMIVTGSADTVGNPASNLDLSIKRARVVADGLVARGIPIERLQVLGRGNSELPVSTDDEVSNADNRSVRISWR